MKPEKLYDKAAANRLATFRKEFVHKNQTQAAGILNIKQPSLSRYESGEIKIDFELVTKLVKNFDLNADWLASGVGTKRNKDTVKKSLVTDIGELNNELSILKKALKMIEANQTYLIRVVETQGKVIEQLQAQLHRK